MPSPSSTLGIPDSLLAKEATGILREHSSDLLFNHSVRVYLFAAEQGRQQKLRFDAELLYVAAAFHDLGLTKKFASQSERFEVDGANAARQFLTAHNVPEEQVQTVWESHCAALDARYRSIHAPGSRAALFGRRSRCARKRVRSVSCEVARRNCRRVPSQTLQGRFRPGIFPRRCTQAGDDIRHHKRRCL